MGSTPPPHRGPGERLAAWIFTGPLGHLFSVVADIGSYWLRQLGRRIRSGTR
ncbi:MAG TPA: hypothetical protein VEX36_03630 [Thermoleophilaceae bacterium]|nr:hypothetical protein [Thermoleophilaceae bacterium]